MQYISYNFFFKEMSKSNRTNRKSCINRKSLLANKESRSNVKLWVWILYFNGLIIKLVSIFFCKNSEKTTNYFPEFFK